MKRLVFAALVAAASITSSATAQEHSAESVASAVLHAYRAQDIQQLFPFFNETNQRFIERYNEDPNQFGDVFAGNRSQAGVNWDGLILPARYTIEPDGTFQAVIPFAEETTSGTGPLGIAGGGRYVAVVLTLDSPTDTSWGFEDVNYIPKSTYEGLLDSL